MNPAYGQDLFSYGNGKRQKVIGWKPSEVKIRSENSHRSSSEEADIE